MIVMSFPCVFRHRRLECQPEPSARRRSQTVVVVVVHLGRHASGFVPHGLRPPVTAIDLSDLADLRVSKGKGDEIKWAGSLGLL
jgi:hypothetical protein